MFVGRRVTVTDVPTLILAANPKRQIVLVSNLVGNTIQLGGSDVTFTTGYQMGVGIIQSYYKDQFSKASTGALYGIANTGLTSTITVLEFLES